jgi:hypothetical protein
MMGSVTVHTQVSRKSQVNRCNKYWSILDQVLTEVLASRSLNSHDKYLIKYLESVHQLGVTWVTSMDTHESFSSRTHVICMSENARKMLVYEENIESSK